MEIKAHIEIEDTVFVEASESPTGPFAEHEGRWAKVVIDEQPEERFPTSWKDGQKVRLSVEVG